MYFFLTSATKGDVGLLSVLEKPCSPTTYVIGLFYDHFYGQSLRYWELSITSSLSGYLDSQGENPVDEGGRETGAEVGHHPVEVRRVHHTRLQQGRDATLGVLAYTNGCVWLMDSQLKILIF